MGKLALVLLMLVSATAGAFGYNPADSSHQPITGLFGIILGVFAIIVASVMNDYLPDLTGKKINQHEFGGGGASGRW